MRWSLKLLSRGVILVKSERRDAINFVKSIEASLGVNAERLEMVILINTCHMLI